jgi:hypothetical protein
MQCVNTTQCGYAFSIQNYIKNEVCNKLQTKHLESIMHAIKGSCNDLDYILRKVQAL